MPERHLGQSLGRFRVDSLIGSGGFAWVYRGYDPELEIPVAIKVLKPQFAGEETFETRFRREASTAAKLRHPNIIRILTVGRQEEAVYFVMDYLPHGLVERLRMMGTLPEPLLVRLGMDVAAALAFAHREGVIHRDIKTDNILFDEHGNAIVADFGIARAVSGYTQQTGTNMVVGTPQYFSPEQARGLALDGRADIYSLGVTMFKAATGVLPFGGDDWYDIARQHIEDAPPKPRSFNPALSRGIEQVILKCLEKDPSERYPSGEALQAELGLLIGKGESSSERTLELPAAPTSGGTSSFASGLRALRLPRRMGRRGVIVSGVTVAASLALILSMTRNPTNAAPRPGEVPDTTQPPAILPGPVAVGGVQPDSAPDSVTTPERTLVVTAPAGATILLDGKTVGRGAWRSSEVSEGAHIIVAMLPTVDGCPTARDSARVVMARAGVTNQRLSPRPCGELAIDAIQAGARFIIAPAQEGAVRPMEGELPLSAPLVLPAGDYTIRVSAPYCADYFEDFTVQAGATHRERVRLIC
ncbi:MAG TPA: serine/threonine-protein kinase [Gemmatimonadaceae bacterium]|nr:serine/threonine-protein kinase [Gemmatimonadaceae bacterium]